MKRGELYKVYKGSQNDPKKYRVFVIVSRQVLIESRFLTVICAPVYSNYDGLSTQILIGLDEGLKHDSAIHCDELISIRKNQLTNFIGSLSEDKTEELDDALIISLALEDSF